MMRLLSMRKANPHLFVLSALISGGGEVFLVKDVVFRAPDLTTEAALASINLADEAEEIIKGSTTVETSRGNVMHVAWKPMMPLHAISSSNCANP